MKFILIIIAQVHDLVLDTIPKFDIILFRHTMVDLKTFDVVKVLKNFYGSRSKYMVATNFPDVEASNGFSIYLIHDSYCSQENIELPKGDNPRHRQINLHLPPFSLPPPVCQSMDGDSGMDYISFWELGMLS